MSSETRTQAGRIVYSTEKGRVCPECGAAVGVCRCADHDKHKRHGSDGIVRIQRQTRGRAGKPVVIVSGIAGTDDELKAIAKQLKKKCGVGGTAEDGNIVIQGDKRDVLKTELERAGYTVKLSGG